MRQLETLFISLPDDIATEGILSSVTKGNHFDIKVTTNLLVNRTTRLDAEPLHISDDNLKARLRTYFKDNVDIVLQSDDFHGEEKAYLASSIAQVGKPEDMEDLIRLIRADIERIRLGRAARAAGDYGPLSNGASMSWARWHIAAITQLTPTNAEQVLIDLLPEPEYLSDTAAAMAKDFEQKPKNIFNRTLRYDLIWNARENHTPPTRDNRKRKRFAIALNAQIKRLQEQNQNSKPTTGLYELAKALAVIDGHSSATVVLDVIATPSQWSQYICLDTAEQLLIAGVVLPAMTVFTLIDFIFEQTEKWRQNPDSHLLRRVLTLCSFVDDPTAGIAKMHEVLNKRRLGIYELRELIISLGESRSDAAIDLLHELASDEQMLKQCGDNLITAIATLDTPRARELLLSFVDPSGITLARNYHHENTLAARLTELARRAPEVAKQLQKLCKSDLPELNRNTLAEVMNRLGTAETLAANLNLIDDANHSPIPQGTWEQLENTCFERRPYGQSSNIFTQHARASNELRTRLFRMAYEDKKRQKSAVKLLGQIEEWRLEYGRPIGEPRHPNLASGQTWPPRKF